MDDLEYGTRDKRGNWTPNATLEIAPFWTGQVEPDGPLPARPTSGPGTRSTSPPRIALLGFGHSGCRDPQDPVLGMGALSVGGECPAGIFLMYGAIELFYYVKRKQGNALQVQRTNSRPRIRPTSSGSKVPEPRQLPAVSFFLGIPIWTAVEVVMLWCFANGYPRLWLARLARQLAMADRAWSCSRPAIHEIHFFFIHRLIHTPTPLQMDPLGPSQLDQPVAPGRPCRCTRSSRCSTSLRSSGT